MVMATLRKMKWIELLPWNWTRNKWLVNRRDLHTVVVVCVPKTRKYFNVSTTGALPWIWHEPKHAREESNVICGAWTDTCHNKITPVVTEKMVKLPLRTVNPVQNGKVSSFKGDRSHTNNLQIITLIIQTCWKK